jgi:hypothetical protein
MILLISLNLKVRNGFLTVYSCWLVWFVVKNYSPVKKTKVFAKICRYRIRGVLSALIFMRGVALAWTLVRFCTIFEVRRSIYAVFA